MFEHALDYFTLHADVCHVKMTKYCSYCPTLLLATTIFKENKVYFCQKLENDTERYKNLEIGSDSHLFKYLTG